MLKRQRPATPPPAPEAPELVPGLSVLEIYHRGSKRRRTSAPSLDGPSRGWGGSIDDFDDDCDDDGEDERYGFQETGAGSGQHLNHWQEVAGVYRNTNSVLHDLHTEHQHRIMFLSPPSSPQVPNRQPLQPYPHQTPPARPLHPQKVYIPLPQESRQYSGASPSKSNLVSPSPTSVQTFGLDETQLVKERYEDANRLLRSLFLGRRRELDDHANPRPQR
ncbi:hypothetical protein JAAARDRAFT_189390 [Jaapia argillacea MUCL 33604]|uniref:Uncharacterized protein n=1 Tax=Jaapia argillacea MUCL 33604 TaxID=933084 RepID=A0A067QA59_9AGAM|nr:hypothetical protein JAAARDRAFT_189390 [Jaapia argillacea MUCL 33604]